MLLIKIELLVIANILLLACDAFVLEVLQEMRKFWLTRNLKTAEPGSYLEDAFLTTPELIKKYKYPAERHYIQTEDGYILGVHRMPQSGREPVLLLHGIFDSSGTFVVMGPQTGLGYYLWDEGHDVWLGNVRGNTYSRNHTSLNPDARQFWNFSFHEMGIYDLPAMVDYILNATGFDRLWFVGHSQGITILLIMCSKKPEYNRKIALAHGIAPVAYLTFVKSPLYPLLQLFLHWPWSEMLSEFLPKSLVFRDNCFSLETIQLFCEESLFLAMGRDPDQFNSTMLNAILGHVPAGAALKQVQHYTQIHRAKKFQEYDYGLFGNIREYKQNYPPPYNLAKVTLPIVLHYSSNDYIATPEDVYHLSKELPNVLEVFEVPIPEWNHMDFVWGIDSRTVVYEPILNFTKNFFCERPTYDV